MGKTRVGTEGTRALESVLKLSHPDRPKYLSTPTISPGGLDGGRNDRQRRGMEDRRKRGRGDLSWNPRGTQSTTLNLSRTFHSYKIRMVNCDKIDVCIISPPKA